MFLYVVVTIASAHFAKFAVWVSAGPTIQSIFGLLALARFVLFPLLVQLQYLGSELDCRLLGWPRVPVVREHFGRKRFGHFAPL